jgi:hypothetical protein
MKKFFKQLLEILLEIIAGFRVSFPPQKAKEQNPLLWEFIKKFKGQRVRGGSCVGLYRQHIDDVWRLLPLEGLGADGGAEGLFTRYDTDVGPLSRRALERIAFDGSNLPQPGDAVIYAATENNRWGHVGIYVEPGKKAGTILIFDQHGFGSQAKAGAQSRKRSMEGVLGWLRKRE